MGPRHAADPRFRRRRAGGHRALRLGDRGRVGVVEPGFRELLARHDWLPRRFQEDAPESGMGSGIGQWLLFRAADRIPLPVQPRRAARGDDTGPRPSRLGARRPLQGQSGRGVLRARGRPAPPCPPASVAAGRLLRAASPARRRAPRAHDLRCDLRVDPSARERHGLRAPPHVRPADRGGEAVPIRLRERGVQRGDPGAVPGGS